MDPILRPPIGFAHRGARAHAPDNTIESFALALKLGASGLESDVWLTADGVAVLDHDGVVRSGIRRRPMSAVVSKDLPPWVPTLEELYETCGTSFHLSLDVKDPAATAPTIAATRAAGDGLLTRLWLCHPEWEVVRGWRAMSDDVRLVDSTRLRRIKEGPERRAASLASAGVDALNLHHSDWTLGLATLFHRFDRVCFGWDAQFERVLNQLLGYGLDGVFSDHVDRMVDAIAAHSL